MLIGYLRGRTDKVDALAAQRQALAEAGCKQVVEDLAAGRRWEQPELGRMLDALQADTVVVVPALECLGRSLPEVVRRMERIASAGAGLRSLKEKIDTTTPEGRAAAGVIDGLAGLDRGDRGERIRAGLATARASGRKPGRRPRLGDEQRAAVVQAVLSGRSTAAEMARHHKVSEATVSRIMATHRVVADASQGGRPGVLEGCEGDKIAGVLPVSALDTRLAIVGTSGSGKTYAAKGLVERLMSQGARVCIVDPLGVWWGLRAGAEGGASPPPSPVVVFGGQHADVPLHEAMGGVLGRLVGTHQLACVVDVSDLGSADARRWFMTAFTEALFATNTEPLHLVLDEADLWAPQRAQAGGQDLLDRIEEIVRRGRVRGFVPWLITQRPAVLHKDVLSQADILLSMKLTSSQDREALGRWIEGQADRTEGRRILAALPRLARGEGWVWAPSDGVLARVAFPRIQTFDSSSTPGRGTPATRPCTLATLDASAVTALLAKRAGTSADEDDEPDPNLGQRLLSLERLERALARRQRALTVVRAQVALIEAEAADIQARLDQVGQRDG